MVSKSGFIPNGRRQNLPRAAKMFKQASLLNGPSGLNAMFNASQIPDNPGYTDFNNPTPPISAPASSNKKIHSTGRPQRNISLRNPTVMLRNNWGGNRQSRGGPIGPNQPKFGIGNRQFNGMDMIRRPMPPIPPPMAMRRPVPPIPIDPIATHFNGPPAPMLRNNISAIRTGRPLPPIPPPMMRRTRNGQPPIRRPNGVVIPGRVVKQKRNSRPLKTPTTDKNDIPSKKTLKEIINQYPLDKPWVTEEIRQEHAKKEEIENKLKGKKNDELFAAFKVQRDKFVGLYESAKEKHLKDAKVKDNEKNMTEPDKKVAENQNNPK